MNQDGLVRAFRVERQVGTAVAAVPLRMVERKVRGGEYILISVNASDRDGGSHACGDGDGHILK